MNQKRPLMEKKLEYAIQHLSDFSDYEDVEPFSSGLSDNYELESEANSKSKLKNDLSFYNSSASTDNEVSEKNQTNESPANQTDTGEVNGILG